MDFASLMSKEIAKSKPPAKQSSQAEQNQQYVRRSELETARVAAYNAEQERLQREREERAERKRKLDEEEAERNRIREEKRRRLAEESRRRREAEEAAKEAERRKRLGLSVTPAEENDALSQRSATPQKQLSDGPIPTTLELLPEAEMKVPDKVPEDEEGKKYLFRQLASYFTMVLKEWEIALSKRDDSVKSTFQGRQAYNAMVQSRDNMKPLFKKFENADVEEGILGPIVEIVRNAQNRRYVDANDGYLRLSIGKAAWPIGVTMVGIHERSAREKLHEGGQDKAHIMSDEITRKFLQSIKRCLTFAQVRWPPDDQLQLMG
ncbi:pre-mRNA splicing factor protein [Coccidioides immitis H538.4]|uniref:Pre-mRNA-splicing factor 18 n=1 Tax=Coccidioides immitis H538.4 TaxID=396776 RepID=A0A0J8RF07_COCIT|nr:pre-mRNA splicing factor protein [Coccidioides immitis H538.4]